MARLCRFDVRAQVHLRGSIAEMVSTICPIYPTPIATEEWTSPDVSMCRQNRLMHRSNS